MKPHRFSLGDLETSLSSAEFIEGQVLHLLLFFPVNKAIYFFSLKFQSFNYFMFM